MKKKKIITLGCVSVIVVAIALFVCPKVIGRKPFAELKAEDIASAAVQLLPPDKTMQVTEIKEFVNVLNDIVIFNKDNSYNEYSGQTVIYTITLNDGKEITVNACNPCIIIDGVGYKTKYEPCERLSQIANDLVRCVSNNSLGEFKDEDDVAEYVNTLINARYSKYFEDLNLACCDYGIDDDGVFYATVFATDEAYSFGACYDIKNKVLTTDASEGYHDDSIRRDVRKTIEETLSFDKPVIEHYMLTIKSENSTEFIEDYDMFISDKGTRIEILLFFDKPISDTEARQVQTLMQKLNAKHFNGSIQCNVGDYYSKELDINKTYKIEEIQKCDQI